MVNALGIDVSKDKLDVVLLNEQQHSHSGVFANHAQGFEQLERWLSKRRDGNVQACLEATGQYREAIAEFLYQAGQSPEDRSNRCQADCPILSIAAS